MSMTATDRTVVRWSTRVFGAMVALAMILIVSAGTASAGARGAVQPLIDATWLLIGIGVTGLLFAGLFAFFKMQKVAIPVGIVAGVLTLAGIGGGILGAVLPPDGEDCGTGQTWNPATLQCEDDDGTQPLELSCGFNTLAAGGPGGAHDASTEFPTSPFVAADAGTPDYDSTIATPIYTGDKIARIDITVDDERLAQSGIGANADGWLPEDTYAFDVHCVLANPPRAIGGGFATVGLEGLLTTPYMFGQTGNSTGRPVFVCDQGNGGVYFGWGVNADSGAAGTGHDANHNWISYRPGVSCNQPPSRGDWMPVGGTSTATPANGEWIAVWFVLDAGIISYEETSVTYTIDVDIRVADNQYASNTERLRIDLIPTDD